jgi:hypothetical protein
LSLATGATAAGGAQYPRARGLEDTLLRSFDGKADPASRRLFQPPVPAGADDPGTHPYVRYELLNKLFNNVTTRSNVFAVWVTVGFFEVDATSYQNGDNPVKLGKEVGSDTGTNKRFRMFSVVDRTNLALDGTNPPTSLVRQSPKAPFFIPFSPLDQTVPGTLAALGPAQLTGASQQIFTVLPSWVTPGQFMYDGRSCSLNVGDRLFIEQGTFREEQMIVSGFAQVTINGQPFTAMGLLTQQNGTAGSIHPDSCSLTNVRLGHPGPQGPIDPKNPRFRYVVPVASILE